MNLKRFGFFFLSVSEFFFIFFLWTMKWRETEEEYFIMVWAGVGGDSFARVFPRIGSRHVSVIVELAGITRTRSNRMVARRMACWIRL